MCGHSSSTNQRWYFGTQNSCLSFFGDCLRAARSINEWEAHTMSSHRLQYGQVGQVGQSKAGAFGGFIGLTSGVPCSGTLSYHHSNFNLSLILSSSTFSTTKGPFKSHIFFKTSSRTCHFIHYYAPPLEKYVVLPNHISAQHTYY